ncbi:MAG TPA: hypothetical protein VIP70_06610 [Nitrososphaeraceae archaeon]
MINKQIGISLIVLTLVLSLFSATSVYADSYKHKDKESKGLRVIIDLVKEDIRDHVLYDRYEDEYYYKDVYDPNLVVVKITVGKGTCWDIDSWGYRGISKIYKLYHDKTIEYVFSKGEVKVGQPFYVYIENLENEHNVCYDGYNHKGKHPEYVTAFLPI